MNFLFKIFVAGAVASCAVPSSAHTWEIIVGSGEGEEGLIKLLASEDSEGESGVYFRCRAGGDWIFLIHQLGKLPRPKHLIVQFGTQQYQPSFRVDRDALDEFYFDAAFPSDFSGFKNLASGQSLRFLGLSYVARNKSDQAAIETFQKICEGGE